MRSHVLHFAFQNLNPCKQFNILSSPCKCLCLYLDAMKTVNIWFLENLNIQLQ
ncbi:hypothetical protein IMY05_016G0047100 [Salix suchowensis]|nr:hypothetical protein IMY05_016G0047100 [Salix suchowensis]